MRMTGMNRIFLIAAFAALLVAPFAVYPVLLS